MPVTERTSQRLVLKSGSTILSLDRDTEKATLQRKLLFWNLRPAQAPISDIADVTIDAAMDRASGVEVCSTMLVMRTGAAWAFPSADKKDAQASADALRGFLGFPSMPPPGPKE
ncbi:MAG TPA: hypothetical protein VGD13_03415 [Xanthobacteraceae bacterium]